MRRWAVAALAVSCTCQPSRPLDAPRAKSSPVIDGKLDEPVWRRAPSTGAFAGQGVVAHTELRASWDAQALYLALYAADEDIGKEDEISVTIGERTWNVIPGTAGVDSDGTIDDPSDDDEEWTAESIGDDLIARFPALDEREPPCIVVPVLRDHCAAARLHSRPPRGDSSSSHRLRP